ncbi:MAG: hypothetical protein JJ863_03520 [Deltaproteobacteria bacterium]|nr:hypothetical protein [Deltaproteobacteria bacterium]
MPAPPESDTDLGYGKLLVELREGHGADVAERISAEVGGSELQDVGVGGLYIMRLSASSAEETRAIAERVGADPAVASATGEWVTDGAADRSTLEHRRHASRSEP